MFKKIEMVLTAVMLTLVAFFAVPAQSAHATIAELFAAVDVSAVSSNVQTLLITFIGILLLFTGYKFIRRTIR